MSLLKERLIEHIRVDGPMPFEQFMAAALYDPEGGFFTSKSLRSAKSGDFLTSPEVSPLFGETLARFVDQELSTLPLTSSLRREGDQDVTSPGSARGGVSAARAGTGGAAERPFLIEVGAGSGSLLRPLLAALACPVLAWAVEASPAARESLTQILRPDHVVPTLDDLPACSVGVIIANELLDNLPVALAVRTGDGWTERSVGVQDGALVLVPVEARPAVAAWAERFGLPAPERGLVEVQLAAGEWLQASLAMLDAGAVLLIDYGDTAENLEKRRVEGTLRTYRAHHLGPHPLDDPGETDITVDVNFTALISRAGELGASVEYHRQDEFLTGLGVRERLSDLRYEELALARDGDPFKRLQVRSARTEAETLLHPRGLGDFRVLVCRKAGTNPGGKPSQKRDENPVGRRS